MSRHMTLPDILQASPVMPVIAIERLEDAVPLAKALVAGGIRVLESRCALNMGLLPSAR